jgi:outer membrane receptor protein involved in Fe transport
MKKLLTFLSILSLLIGAISTVHGDETSPGTEQKGKSMKHLTMEEIVVTDEAITEPTVTVVGVKTIEKGKNTNIPDVLKYEPEIDISRRALVGDTGDTLKIRGLSGNRIMLNIDGRSVNAAGVQGGYFIDWSTIPLDNIEKIEVIKGGSSVKYGNNAGGGVINVITKKPTEKPTFTFYGTYGGGEDISYIQNYRLTHTYKIGPVGYSIAGSYQKADEFLWNNDYEAKNLAGKFYIDMPLKGEMTLGVQYTNVDRGFTILNRLSSNPDYPNFYVKRNPDYPLSFGESFSPGAGNVTTPGSGANWEKTKYLLDFGYKQPIGNASVDFKAYKNYEDRDEKNYSASWINNKYPDGKLVLDRTVKSDRSYGGSFEFTMPVKNHEILGGIERKVISTGGQDVHFVDVNYGVKGTVSGSSGQSAYMWGSYLQDTWSITDAFLLTPGIRFDTYEVTESDLGPELSIKDEGVSLSLTGTYRLTKDDILTASIYRKYLTPSAPDSWWWYEGYAGGLYNTVLKLEKNDAVELTYRHDFSQEAFARLSLYHYTINDYIKRYSVPEGRGCYNIDNAKLTGASIDGSAEILIWMTVRGNITYQKSKKEGDIMDPTKLTDELEYMPEWKGNLGFDLKLPYKAVFSAFIRYVGERETIYSNKIRELDSYTTSDVELKIQVTKHGEIGVYAENLFDKKYEERFGYPLPGRIIGAAIKIAL